MQKTGFVPVAKVFSHFNKEERRKIHILLKRLMFLINTDETVGLKRYQREELNALWWALTELAEFEEVPDA